MDDALTGLGSRYRFDIEARLLFETARGSSSGFTLGMMDIDHFKKVNDTYGHSAGDMILKQIAQCCKKHSS